MIRKGWTSLGWPKAWLLFSSSWTLFMGGYWANRLQGTIKPEFPYLDGRRMWTDGTKEAPAWRRLHLSPRSRIGCPLHRTGISIPIRNHNSDSQWLVVFQNLLLCWPRSRTKASRTSTLSCSIPCRRKEKVAIRVWTCTLPPNSHS